MIQTKFRLHIVKVFVLEELEHVRKLVHAGDMVPFDLTLNPKDPPLPTHLRHPRSRLSLPPRFGYRS